MIQSCKEPAPSKMQRNPKCSRRASCSSMISNKTCPAQDILARTLGIAPARDVSKCSRCYWKLQKALQKQDFLIWLRKRQQDLVTPALGLLGCWSTSAWSTGLPVLSTARVAVAILWPAPTNHPKLHTKLARVQGCLSHHNSITSAAAPTHTWGKQSWEEQDGIAKETAMSCSTLMLFLKTLSKIWDYVTIRHASSHQHSTISNLSLTTLLTLSSATIIFKTTKISSISFQSI